MKSVRIFGWCHSYHPDIISNKNFISNNEKLNPEHLDINLKTANAIQAYNSNKSYYENFQFLSGHLPFSSYSNDENRLTITILREPISRAISNYQFFIQKGFIHEHEDLEYLLEKKILKSNLTTEFFSNENKPNIKTALKNLKKIDIATDIIHIDKLLNYLISIFNLPNIILAKENVTQKKLKLKNNQIELIKHYNSLDFELYNQFKEICFKFDQYENNTERNNDYFSFFSSKKIFNNAESIIFEKENLNFVINHLKNI